MNLSYHAIARGQQRSIPDEIIELILAFGKTERRPGQATAYRIDKRDINRAIDKLKRQIRMFEKAQNKVVLTNEIGSTVITVYVCK